MFQLPIKSLFLTVVFHVFILQVGLFSQNNLPTLSEIQQVKSEILPDLDMQKIQKEDQSKELDIRFAVPIDCNFSMEENGVWTENKNGIRTWIFSISSKDAVGISLLFENFYLPQQGKLYAFSSDKKYFLPVISSKNNNTQNVFITDLVKGDKITLYYEEPATNTDKPSFEITKIFHAYKKYLLQLPQNEEFMQEGRSGEERLSFGFGTSLSCNKNINCPDVDTLAQTIKKSTVRITMVLKEGMGYCTGTLMNNTLQDGKPYILTAFHCQDGYTPYYNLWKFDFNYESSDCSNPIQEPVAQSIIGCNLRSGWQKTDFLLLELTSPIPTTFNAFYSGWNRKNVATDSKLFAVHHPSGDIKKFTETDGSKLTIVYPYSIQWNNQVTTPANHHFKMVPTKGIFEVGSSGCGLFNAKKQFLGNFNGGDFNACSVTGAYFGRLSVSWTGNGTKNTRLKDWLDPTSTDTLELNGKAIQNNIVFGNLDNPLKNGNILFNLAAITEKPTGVFKTDTFSISKVYNLLIPNGAVSYTLQPFYTSPITAGVSTADLVLMTKHILGVSTFTEDWQKTAADVNLSNTISTADIVELRKVILALKTTFDKQNIWNLKITNVNMSNMVMDQSKPSIKLLPPYLNNNIVDFIGMKIGDVNGNGY